MKNLTTSILIILITFNGACTFQDEEPLKNTSFVNIEKIQIYLKEQIISCPGSCGDIMVSGNFYGE